MKQFLIGVVGALLFSSIVAFVLLRFGGMQPTVLYYAIVCIAGLNGFIMFSRTPTRRRR